MPRTMNPDATLNAKEEAACNHLIAGHTQGDAYALAGYWVGKAHKTAQNQAYRFFTVPKIVTHLAKMRAAAAEKALVDRAYVITGYRRLYEHAAQFIPVYAADGKTVRDFRPRHWAEARKNLEILAREVGVGVPVQKHEVGRPGDFARMTADETRAELAELFRARGLDEGSIAALLASPPGGTA